MGFFCNHSYSTHTELRSYVYIIDDASDKLGEIKGVIVKLFCN